MTDDQIKYMANRFLAWRLPADFLPDNGISYARPNYAPSVDATPVGTNLLNATQAEAMVRFIVEGLAQPPAATVEAVELLPCPFCGGDSHLGGGTDGSFVNCTDCLASTNILRPEGQTDSDAIAHWNRRASLTTQAVEPEEAGSDCFNCNKAIRVGQVVLPWNDACDCHANCAAPYALDYVRQEGDPEPVVLVGSPMQYLKLPAVVEQQNIRKALNTLIITVNAADELIERAYGTGNPEVWKGRMDKCIEARAFLSTVKGEWL